MAQTGLDQASVRIGFLGAGKMATALARGWLAAGLPTADRLPGQRPGPRRPRRLRRRRPAAPPSADNRAVVAAQRRARPRRQAADDGRRCSPRSARPSTRAAPGRLDRRRASRSGSWPTALGAERRLVRVMPNTPCLVGASASGYAAGADGDAPTTWPWSTGCSTRSARRSRVPEHLLDAVTGLQRQRAGVRLRDHRGAERRRRPHGPAARRGDGAGGADGARGGARWCWRRACTPARSRTWSPAPAARPSPACTPWSAAACAAALMDAVEAATRRATELGKSTVSDDRHVATTATRDRT